MPDRKKKKSGKTRLNSKELLKEIGLFVADILYNAVVIIILVVLIRSFLISPFRVMGASMEDTLYSNEFILIDRLSYRLGIPERGDAVVFRPPITNYRLPGAVERSVSGNRCSVIGSR